jgi:hypothetical protein
MNKTSHYCFSLLCFPAAALPDLLSRYGFISLEGKLSEAFGCCSVEAF